MANALSDLKLPQADQDYMVSGEEEGDGTDYGLALFTDGIHRQDNPDADRVWDEPEQLAALIAKEEPADIDDEDESLGDDTDVEILDEQEYDTGWLNREPPAWYTFVDMLADENAVCDWDGGLVTDPIVPGEDDTRQGGVIGVRRLVGGNVCHNATDNFRRKRQRVTRPRKAAAKAKEAMAA